MLIQTKRTKYFFSLILCLILTGCTTLEDPDGTINNGNNAPPTEEKVVKEIYFKLDGEDFTFPLEVSSFIENGWQPTVSLEGIIIEANTYIPNYFFRKGTSIVKVALYNPTSESVSYQDSLISEIGFENRTFKQDVAPDITVNDFLNFETSVPEITEIFGEPTVSDDAIFDRYDYKIDQKNSIRVEFYKDKRDGEVSRWIYLTSYKN